MKPPRLQFSLRMLLLLMAVVGICLAIYRWPWQESKFSYRSFGQELTTTTDIEFERRTTYRRDWRGRAVKHGTEQSFRNGELWQEANYYEGELSGRRRVWNAEGRLAIEGTYLAGELHGPYRSGNGQEWTAVGQYVRDRLDGEWRTFGSCRNDVMFSVFEEYCAEDGTPKDTFTEPEFVKPGLIISHWRDGKRHGSLTWQTRAGEVLNTAEYAEGELVAWNGQPVVEQFLTWLRTLDDPQLVAQLSAPWGHWYPEHLQADEFVFEIRGRTEPPQLLQIHREGGTAFRKPRAGITLAASLCEFAALEGLGFDYRYGFLWLVPRAADPTPPFVDPTGVAQVQFASGSLQEREWLEPIEVSTYEGGVSTCLQHLLGETSIACDFSAIGGLVWRDQSGVVSEPIFTRSRRDVVFLVLYRTGYRCEQQGNTLRILPRWQEPPEDPQRGPLSLTRWYR